MATRNGRLNVELSPGSYALRVSEAGVARYTDFVLRAGEREFAIDVSPTAFASSAPLDHTSTTHEWHRYPAIDRSREIPQEYAQGVLVFVREVAPSKHRELAIADLDPRRYYARAASDFRPADPGAGLTLRDADGELLFDLIEHGKRDESAHWAAGALGMQPGLYRLRSTDRLRGTSLELPLVVPRGRFLHVFLFARERNGLLWPDLGSATIFVSRDREFRPDHPGRHAEALAQEVMRANRRMPHARAMLAQHGPWIADDAPMLGLCLGYLALRDPGVDDALRASVLDVADVLREQLGDHPDVLALRLAASPGAPTPRIERPPMFAASWRSIVEASYPQPDLVERGSLLDRIAETAVSASPWFTWSRLSLATTVEAEHPTNLGHIAALLAAPLLLDAAAQTRALSRLAARIAHAIAPHIDEHVRDLERRYGIPAVREEWTVEILGRTVVVPRCTLERGIAELRDFLFRAAADSFLSRGPQQGAADATTKIRERFHSERIVGRSQALARVLSEAALVAPLSTTVLLTGPNGAGKSLLARAIATNSPRGSGPYIDVSCAAIPETLLESELFGFEPGAFTGANRRHLGKVAVARGGTLFLDEIGELSMGAQAKLLQLLQERRYYALGSATPVAADVRIISATNADLKALVAQRRFREDLYYRLAVMTIAMPSLEERRDDIPELVERFCTEACERNRLRMLRPTARALLVCREASWPGNIRELANAIEVGVARAIFEGAVEVDENHIFPAASPRSARHSTFREATRQFQRRLLEEALVRNEWNITRTAAELEIGRRRVLHLISTFGLQRP